MSGHSTYGSYQRGCHCSACVKANAAYMREYRKRPGRIERHRMRVKAEWRALQRLRLFHPTDYRAFYEHELGELEREARQRAKLNEAAA